MWSEQGRGGGRAGSWEVLQTKTILENQKMLAKNPDDRYKSMKEVIAAIQNAQKGSGGSIKIPGWLWAIIGIVIGAAITAAILMLR